MVPMMGGALFVFVRDLARGKGRLEMCDWDGQMSATTGPMDFGRGGLSVWSRMFCPQISTVLLDAENSRGGWNGRTEFWAIPSSLELLWPRSSGRHPPSSQYGPKTTLERPSQVEAQGILSCIPKAQKRIEICVRSRAVFRASGIALAVTEFHRAHLAAESTVDGVLRPGDGSKRIKKIKKKQKQKGVLAGEYVSPRLNANKTK